MFTDGSHFGELQALRHTLGKVYGTKTVLNVGKPVWVKKNKIKIPPFAIRVADAFPEKKKS